MAIEGFWQSIGAIGTGEHEIETTDSDVGHHPVAALGHFDVTDDGTEFGDVAGFAGFFIGVLAGVAFGVLKDDEERSVGELFSITFVASVGCVNEHGLFSERGRVVWLYGWCPFLFLATFPVYAVDFLATFWAQIDDDWDTF